MEKICCQPLEQDSGPHKDLLRETVEHGSNYVGNFLMKDSVLMWLAVD